MYQILPNQVLSMDSMVHHATSASTMHSYNIGTTFLTELDLWNFDVFQLKAHNRPLSTVALLVFKTHGLLEAFGIDEDILTSFLQKAEDMYQANPYHNRQHATDVVQAIHWFLLKLETANFPAIDKLAMVFSAVCHDLGHPGVNNNFLVYSGNPLALEYNDMSVLEQMHTSRAFQLLHQPEYNFLANLSRQQFRTFRMLSISLIFATDMAKHMEIISEFNTLSKLGQLDVCKDAHRLLLCKTLMKIADVSNCGRPWKTAQKWAGLVAQEFYAQGDAELTLQFEQISPFMDRRTADMAKMQASFIQFVVLPLMETVLVSVPSLEEPLQNAKFNLACWQAQSQPPASRGYV
eukprot:TRINITY_DN1391_c0_g1_i8.p1 TRINITY_DN1391_c0_g1~~TRINITY_DN1391_c0_g1_i8.p1  ORF type:complete len:349 (+),score=84.26 TRINITY_DN1391_c0_g1_i8:132-1178(+)